MMVCEHNWMAVLCLGLLACGGSVEITDAPPETEDTCPADRPHWHEEYQQCFECTAWYHCASNSCGGGHCEP